MGFIDETKKMLNINKDFVNQTFCYLSPENGIVIEGYKKIYELSNTKITVYCEDKKRLEVFGEHLIIKEISFKELAINGKITTVNIL